LKFKIDYLLKLAKEKEEIDPKTLNEIDQLEGDFNEFFVVICKLNLSYKSCIS